MAFLIFYVTHPDEASAQKMSDELLGRRLAACANIFPISSVYWWQGEMSREGEWVSILKTRSELEQPLEAAVQALHRYQTPCIMRWAVSANKAYEQWIRENCGEE